MRRKRWIVGTALGASLALGGGGIALAATAVADGAEAGTRLSDGEEHRARALAEFSERLAERLGMDAAEVSEAVEAVTEELRAERTAEREAALLAWVDDALAEGRISEDEAEELRERIESGDAPGRGRGPGHLWGPGGSRPWEVPGPPSPDAGAEDGSSAGSATSALRS